MNIRSQYSGICKVLGIYWDTYGGASALVTSPFFHAALGMTLLCTPLWWAKDWWEKSISILPSVLGFSIAAFTLMLGVGDEGFRRRLGVQRTPAKPSTLTNTSASLVHFIIVQIVALTVAIFASSRPLSFLISGEALSHWALIAIAKAFRAAGFFLLCYALFTALAATLSIFRLATLFSTYATKSNGEPQPANGPQEKPDRSDSQSEGST